VPTPRPWSAAAPAWQRRLFALLPVATVPVALAVMGMWRRGYDAVLREDRVAEGLTFLVYVAAAGVALRLAVTLRRRALLPAVLHGLLGVGLLVVAGEEISWGQRQLGFAGPPELVEQNHQGEANVHNLLGRYALHASFIAVGLYGAGLGRLLVRRVPGLRDAPHLYAPAPVLAAWFGCVAAYYAYVDYGNPLVVRALGPGADLEQAGRLQEAPELVLALGFLWFLLMAAERARAEPSARNTLSDVYPGSEPTAADVGAAAPQRVS
jgi:hypothetical protein